MSSDAVEHNVAEQSQPGHVEAKLSKHQMKRKAKLESILKNRSEKRRLERERNKLKRKLKRATEPQSESYKDELKQTRKSLKKNLMINSTNKLRICIDCSFESLMSVSDLNHLSKQIAFCYAANRRLKQPLQFYMTDYNGN
jgi:tRNA (guanine9-N1)-methyltransferase